MTSVYDKSNKRTYLQQYKCYKKDGCIENQMLQKG